MSGIDLQAEEARLSVLCVVRIAKAMKKARVSRTELARRIGITPQTLSRMLSGSANLTLRTLAKLGLALNVHWNVAPFKLLRSKAKP